MNRRGFLQSMLATGATFAIARSGVLMPVREIVRPAWVYSHDTMPRPEHWHTKTPEQILADFNLMMKQIYRNQVVYGRSSLVLTENEARVIQPAEMPGWDRIIATSVPETFDD